MSLRPIESVQLNAFLSSGAFSTGTYHGISNTFSEAPQTSFVYLDRLNLFLCVMFRIGGGDTDGLGTIDPRFADNTAPLSQFYPRNPTPAITQYLAVGEWDKANNVQRLYGGVNSGSVEIWPIDQSTYQMSDPGASIWPFGWNFSGVPISTIGGWNNLGGHGGGEFVFFETLGVALKAVANVRHTDNNLYNGLAQIDLTTGLATLIDGVPTVYTNAPAALFETGEFDGSSFELDRIQFVPDDDSLPAAPKGRLVLSSTAPLTSAGDTAGSIQRYYIKVVEWNPFSVAPAVGTPNRVHKRQILLTRALYILRQPFGTNPNSQGDFIDGGSISQDGNRTIRFDPRSSTFILLNDTANIQENERGFVRHADVPVLDRLEPVTRLATVRAGQTNSFRTRALGDLSDPIAGLDVDWSLAKQTSVDEPLDTAAAGPTSTVANPPIDSGTLVVELNGTPLTDGVDYTVVESTGVITWAGSQSPPQTSGYTATYQHVSNPTTPPNGQLLQAASQTDVDGNAETTVRYAEDSDLVGIREAITASADDGF